MTLRLYLCGSVAGRSAKEMREEREAAAADVRERGWTPVDPLAGEYDTLKRRRNIQDDQSELTPANITLKDKYAIEQCDMILWITADIASYGSCIEVGFAWALGKPVVCVDPTKRGRRSAFVAHISTFIGDTLEDALDFIEVYMTVPENGEEGED
jgi:nucleoside 2-deoxyribosyltransferase